MQSVSMGLFCLVCEFVIAAAITVQIISQPTKLYSSLSM